MPAVKWSGAGCEMGADRVTERQSDRVTLHIMLASHSLVLLLSLSVEGGQEAERKERGGILLDTLGELNERGWESRLRSLITDHFQVSTKSR